MKVLIILMLVSILSGCLLESIKPVAPIKPYLRHLEKPGVTDEQRREDCRACGGLCGSHLHPKSIPEVCWSNPSNPSKCTDYLDHFPYFSGEKLKAAGLLPEGRDPKLYYDESRLIGPWKQCMFGKGYTWNPSSE